MTICPSAQEEVSVSNIIREFCNNEFFRQDYQEITNYFSEDYVEYDETIRQMMKLAEIIEKIEKQ